jgi:pimeloyl-ACP methyl ester carboxylesterase
LQESGNAEAAQGLAAGIAFEDSRPGGFSGAPLVLVHGAGGTRLHWPEALRAMPGRRVIALDLPGHGRSPGGSERTVAGYAQRVLALLDALGVEAAVVVGHSLGGAIALTLALEAQARVAGLVLVGTGARLRVSSAVLEATANPVLPAQAARGMAERSVGPGASEALLGELVEGLRANAPGVLHGDFLACDAFDVMGRLGEVSAPTLVVCGTEDRLTPLKYSEFLCGKIRGARLERIAGAGHLAMLEAPDQVAAAVRAFAAAR